MANYQTLKSAIQQVVKTNGNNEITGALLQQSLLAMINSLGAGFQFMGVATPAMNPGTLDQNAFYLATSGTYTNFSNIVVNDDEIAILKYSGQWEKSSLPITNWHKDKTLNVTIQQGEYISISNMIAVDKKANEYVVVNFKTDANVTMYSIYYRKDNPTQNVKLADRLTINKKYVFMLPEDAIGIIVYAEKVNVLSSGTGEFVVYNSINEVLAIGDIERQKKLLESFAYTNKKTFNDIPVYNGKYLKADGTLSDADSDGYYSDILPVADGDSFIYSGKVMYNNPCIYVITDIYGSAISFLNTPGTYTDEVITINEPNAAYIRFGSYGLKPTIKINYSPSMQQYVDGKVTDLASKIGDLNLRPKTLYNLFNSATITNGKYVIQNTGELGDDTTHCASDFIPVVYEQYYTFPIDPRFFGSITSTYVALYDSSKTYIGAVNGVVSENNPNILTIQITNAAAKYIRVTAMKRATQSSYSWLQNYEIFMVVNAQSYPTRYYPYGEIPQYLDGELSPENYAMTNPLFGKMVIFDGDSICNANDDINKYGWAGRIGTKNKMLWQNLAVGGGTFTNGGWGTHVISETDYGFANPDYIIIEGGTNDADRVGSIINGSTPEKYGSFSPTGYTDNFTTATYCGAIESLFKRLLSNYPNAKIGVIIAQKMGVSQDYTKTGNNRRAYFETLMTLCQKWGIPYINLWDNGRLNPRLESFYNNTESSFYTDGQHLTERGYGLITPIIEQWMKTL